MKNIDSKIRLQKSLLFLAISFLIFWLSLAFVPVKAAELPKHERIVLKDNFLSKHLWTLGEKDFILFADSAKSLEIIRFEMVVNYIGHPKGRVVYRGKEYFFARPYLAKKFIYNLLYKARP